MRTVTRKWNLELNPAGTPPEPRSFHTVTAAGSRVVVIGGRGRDNSHFADVHLFDSGKWYTTSQPFLDLNFFFLL